MMSRPARLNPVPLTRTTTACRAFRRMPAPQTVSGTALDRQRGSASDGRHHTRLPGLPRRRTGRKAAAQCGSATDIGAVSLNCRFGLSRGAVLLGSSRTLARVSQCRTCRSWSAVPGEPEQGGNRQVLLTRNRVLSLVRRTTMLVWSTPWQYASLPPWPRIGDHARGQALGAFLWREVCCGSDR